ncbi:MAG: FtsL-like putative cell division protein [Bacteroidota bacterium]
MRIISNPRNNPTRRGVKAQPSTFAGKGLSSRKVNDYLRFCAFLALIGMVYIWNSFRAERYIEQREVLRVEVKNLKSRYRLYQAQLGAETRFMALKNDLDSIGLYPLKSPAFRLVADLKVPISRLDTPRRDLDARREEIRMIQDSLQQLQEADSCYLIEPPEIISMH